MKRIILLGATGSIGTQVLQVVRAHPGEFEITGLSARKNKKLFAMQGKEFKPKYTLLTETSEHPEQALADFASLSEADLVINAITGVSGLAPTYAAVKAGKKIALANKESLVMAGELLMSMCKKTGAEIIPIDSELSAVWQMLHGGPAYKTQNIEKIILTASGGPLWGFSKKQLQHVTPEQARKHPTWQMGEKISIDSATFMNKAFEIIETRWLFDIPPEKIEAVIHRQSIIHALVEWIDGNTSAVMSPPDMRIPISYALFYPERRKNAVPHAAGPQHARLSPAKAHLTFEKPDYSIFEGPQLAYEVLREGGIMPAVFCLADEIAVQKFLRGEISFLGIYDFIKRALSQIKNIPFSLSALREASAQIFYNKDR